MKLPISLSEYSEPIMILDGIERAVEDILPEEKEPPIAEFDCEPTLKMSDGTMRYDWSAYMRRQFRQEELDVRWEERLRIRNEFLEMINKLSDYYNDEV